MERISDHRPAADVYPITQNGRVEMLSGVGSFTSACAITLYLGGALPSLGLFSLTAEPAQNLVHRDVLTPSGATYVAWRAHERVEFLASTDAWFRPVNFYIGPDAAIYMVDYYRMIIEHPEWMSTHTHHSPDLYKGEDRGRIYRIVPETGLPMPAKIHAGRHPTWNWWGNWQAQISGGDGRRGACWSIARAQPASRPWSKWSRQASRQLRACTPSGHYPAFTSSTPS